MNPNLVGTSENFERSDEASMTSKTLTGWKKAGGSRVSSCPGNCAGCDSAWFDAADEPDKWPGGEENIVLVDVIWARGILILYITDFMSILQSARNQINDG